MALAETGVPRAVRCADVEVGTRRFCGFEEGASTTLTSPRNR